MIINKYECKECGMCCKKAPCDIIPEDLPIILEKYDLDFKEFFRKYLIVLPTVSNRKADTILRLVPVKKKLGRRLGYYFADKEYMDEIKSEGECIFLENNKCTVHDTKPLGGRIMICPNMADGLSLQLTPEQYFVFWFNNQHIFKELSNEIDSLLIKSRELYSKADTYFNEAFFKGGDGNTDKMYLKYKEMADSLIYVDLKRILNTL